MHSAPLLTVLGGLHQGGGVCPTSGGGGGLHPGGLPNPGEGRWSASGGSAQPRGGGWSASRGVCPTPGGSAYRGVGQTPLPPVNRMALRCKNITLPQTSFAGGNKFTSVLNNSHPVVNDNQI